MNSRVFFHRHSFVAIAMGCLFILIAKNLTFTQQKRLSDPPYELSAPFFKFVTGGFWPAAADTLWIQTIQQVGSANYSSEYIPSTREFYRLATDLDPNFYELYEQGSILFAFFFEAAEPAEEILKKGIRVYESGKQPQAFWTHPYTLYIFLANVYAFQMNDWAKAKEIYLRASYVPNAPEYLVRMRDWLNKENSEKILARRVLQQLIQNTQDPIIRAKYEERLKKYEP